MERKVKLSDRQTMTFDDNNTKVYESPEAWTKEGNRRFGDNYMDWKFLCPMCGHIASVQDFKNAGAKDPNCAYQECIGRYTGKSSPVKGDSSGCDWCAYGLFGIPKGGVIVMRDKENASHIFDFAPEE